jgi:hypothetical protein
MQNLPFATQQEQVNKFLQANRVLGAQMDQMQGTTRIIYDQQAFNGSTSYDFFSQVASKQSTLVGNQLPTNITDNRFEPGEGMVVKEIALYNATADEDILDLSTSVIGLGLINFYIGNNKVIKDLPIMTGQSFAQINNLNPISSSTAEQAARRFLSIRLFTNIVIPPQVQFYCNITLPVAPANIANERLNFLRVYLKGYGKLFNPRNNY